MKQVKGLLYFYLTNYRYSQMIFWFILTMMLVVSLSLSYFLLSVDDWGLYFGFFFGTYGYSLILGFNIVKDLVPYSLKLGATRKNMYISLAIFFVAISVGMSIISNTLQTLAVQFNKLVGITNFEFLHFANFLDQNGWFIRVVVDSIIMIFFFTLMFILGLIFYRTGLLGGGIVTGTLTILLLFGVAKGWVIDFILEVFESFQLVFFYQILGAAVLIYGIGYFFIRKISIIKAN